MELIKCDSCKTDLKPTSDQLNFILSSKEKGMTFIMLECGNCEMSLPINPFSPKQLDEKSSETPIRTPISGSHGYISFVDSKGEKFYGCGEPGAIWRSEQSLFRDIEVIIAKYSHRKSCYVKIELGWLAKNRV